MNKSVRLLAIAILHLALLWGWVALLDGKRGPLPPVGRFVSPFEGFWRNGEPLSDTAASRHGSHRGEEVVLEGLTATVVAEYDHRGVPHLFAPDLHALFFAQGYVTARDRLWQMDIQSRAGLGRLAEVMGPGLLGFDRERRRLGMPASARAALEVALRDSLTRVALEGYSAGVNAWITSLKRAGYPLEFKLLDYVPEPWTPLKSLALVKNMQWTLSRDREDVGLTRVLDSLGSGFFSRYYPLRHPGAEPVFPKEILPQAESDSAVHGPKTAGLTAEKIAGVGGPPGGHHNSQGQSSKIGLRGNGTNGSEALVADLPGLLASRPDPGSGSNNFVIARARTREGAPLLANDPHLDLTLPSLWYEIQLKSGDLNAYGVSIVGLPGIVSGFSASTAWGFTNGMNDVFDWLALRFRGDSLDHYLWRGRWRPVRRVVDTILVRGREPVIDTQLWTHIGPIPVHGTTPGAVNFGDAVPPLHALQWTALEPSNELGAFLRLLTARNVPTFRRALRGLETPAQNAVFANRTDIALGHFGRVPQKRMGQGRLLARGTVSTTEWRSYLPPSELPFASNPERGWLASANQELTDADDPHYYGSGFYPPERSQRLHRLLVSDGEATLSSAWEIMRDDYSRLAARALPLLLRHLPPDFKVPDVVDSAHMGDSLALVDSQGAEGHADTFASPEAQAEAAAARIIREESRRAVAALQGWDYRYTITAIAPALFDAWWSAFCARVWIDDLRGDTVKYPMPPRSVTLALLAQDSLSAAFDDARTTVRESAGTIARAAFDDALDTVRARRAALGLHADSAFTWGRARPVSIPHLLRLGPLGVKGLEVNGCRECVNAQKTSHGPSWRMAVQTGKRPEAWGIYPGGQSGNPGSPRYAAFVKDWAEGRGYRLLFLKWPLEVPDSTSFILALKAKR